MKIKDTVFGSGPERALYKALKSAWPDRINLYPSIPFLNVVDISGARLSNVEREYLKKTSLDYTACEKDSDRPLLSVEFDGLGHGYSRDGQYFFYERIGESDPYRREKMNVKLRLAEEVGYPLFVVSYEEAAPITPDDELTVTHGIVGKCLSALYFIRAATQRLQEQQTRLDGLPPPARDEAIEHLLIGVEVTLDFEWNPLAVAAGEAMEAVYRTGLLNGQGNEWVTDPPLPETKGLLDVEGIKRRIAAAETARRFGARVTLHHAAGQVVREAWVRPVSGPGVIPWGIADDLAELLAARAFLDYVRSGGQ